MKMPLTMLNDISPAPRAAIGRRFVLGRPNCRYARLLCVVKNKIKAKLLKSEAFVDIIESYV